MTAFVDHLVITAPSLDAGAAFIREKLGVQMQPGGEHPRMGTHNRLLSLGPAVYLEVISVNPEAPRPTQPRWFGLAAPAPAPRLATWVARVDDIEAAVRACPDSFGEIQPMSRGPFRWRITIPRDGSLVSDGVMPSLIQWETEPHPASRLTDIGCRLFALAGCHPQAARIEGTLKAIDFSGPVTIIAADRPELRASINTDEGACTL